MSRLLLVRHGQSAWNAIGRWQGHADPPLSEQGEREAADAAASLVGIELVVSSDLQRARRTAELLAGGRPLGPSYPQLRERDVGEWSGLTNEEVDAAFPGARAAGRTPPGWETEDSLVERVLPVLTALLTEASGEVLVVSHGGVLRAVESHLGRPGAAVTADNLCGYWLERGPGGPALGEQVRLLG